MNKNLPRQVLPKNLEVIQQLKDYFQDLIDIAMQEEFLLADQKIDEIVNIIPIKINILQQIDKIVKQFNNNDQAQTVDESTRNIVIKLHQALYELLSINQTKFAVAKETNAIIIQMMSDQLIQSKRQAYNYNASGDTFMRDAAYKHMPPLTLNKKI